VKALGTYLMKAVNNLSFNCYGESLDTSPDFLLAKRAYEESLVDWNEGDNNVKNDLQISEHIPNFDTPLKKNLLLKQLTNNEKDILRNNVEPVGETGNPTKMV
jgi:hypothetical protein